MGVTNRIFGTERAHLFSFVTEDPTLYGLMDVLDGIRTSLSYMRAPSGWNAGMA